MARRLRLARSMRPILFLFLSAVLPMLPIAALADGEDAFNHRPLDRVLGVFVDERGRVDYASLKANPGDLKAYVRSLEQVSPESHSKRFSTRADRLAYWINAYNALVLHGVLDAYPVKSVREIKWAHGFFNRTSHTVGGKQYTLNHIEHEIIRKRFADPRIHAAINCASIGCPRLPQQAFQPETLDRELDAAIRFFVREPRNVRIDREAGALYLSEIFKWFEGDFTGWYRSAYGGEEASLAQYVMVYLIDEDRAYLEQQAGVHVRFIPYDWALNDLADPEG